MNKNCIVESKKFGAIDGQDVYLFRLANTKGTSVEVISYGATIKSINVLDEQGTIVNIVLGYDSLEEYVSDTNYLGATIGRCANRISNASFVMDGETYLLDKNDGLNCNHGGYSGFHQKIFDHRIEDEKLILGAKSPDGEGGFPGNVVLTVTYQLTERDELVIDYHVSSDKKTPVNITNHAYFNLSGEKTIEGHLVKIEADRIVESDDDFLPTGAIVDVEKNEAFDFREFRKIGDQLKLKSEKIRGYNSYFIAREKGSTLKKLATLKSVANNRGVELFSTMPGVMMYTGDYLSGPHEPFSGVSLEAHYYPDTPNWAHFPVGVYAEGADWNETIVYRFSGSV